MKTRGSRSGGMLALVVATAMGSIALVRWAPDAGANSPAPSTCVVAGAVCGSEPVTSGR